MVQITTLGLHRVPDSDEPCWLIEILVRGLTGPFDDDITQELTEPQEWTKQGPYHLMRLNADGTDWIPWNVPWTASERLCFFFHFLDVNRPLTGCYGSIMLPKETAMPERLARVIPYLPPD